MAVNLTAPDPKALPPVPCLRIGTAMAGIRKANRRDLVAFMLDNGSAVAGLFMRNRFCAAPVQLCRERLDGEQALRALLVNTGNVHAGTGADGLARTEHSGHALADLDSDHWVQAAEGMMATDTQPKAASRQITIGGRTVTLTGISKGAGMIRPNMATMLGFMTTDPVIARRRRARSWPRRRSTPCASGCSS